MDAATAMLLFAAGFAFCMFINWLGNGGRGGKGCDPEEG
jgi:hypothetical protein